MSAQLPAAHEVSGVIHCHSTFSDGAEDIPAIAAAANRAGLDFLLMTDHDTLEPLHRYGERWWDRTLVLMGAEITPRWNHYLVYNITDLPSFHLQPQEYINQVASQGGIGFLAHPWEQGSRLLRMNEYGWKDWEVTGFTGMEIWNYFSTWVGGCTSLGRTLRGLLDWRRVDGDPDPRTLAKWDELGQHRRVVGIGGVDAHGVKRKVAGVTLTLHPYTRSFRTVRTHLLLSEPFTGDVARDRELVMAALVRGRAWLANWQVGDPSGFRFVGRSAAGWHEPGDEVPADQGPVHFSVAMPRRKPLALVRLLRNGEPLRETEDTDLQAVSAGPGVYRVEAHLNGRAWIFSNPIYIR